MITKTAYGLVALMALTGCQTMKNSRPSWAANATAKTSAEPVFDQQASSQNAAGAVASGDASALATASARIDQVAAAAASGSPPAYSASQADFSSYQPSSTSRPFRSSTCSSGCCSN